MISCHLVCWRGYGIYQRAAPQNHARRKTKHGIVVLTVDNNDVKMSAMASQIARLTTVYSGVYSGADQRKYQSFASLAFVRGIHRWPANYPHKGPITRKMFPFDDVIMNSRIRGNKQGLMNFSHGKRLIWCWKIWTRVEMAVWKLSTSRWYSIAENQPIFGRYCDVNITNHRSSLVGIDTNMTR